MQTSNEFARLLEGNLAAFGEIAARIHGDDDVSGKRMVAAWVIHRCFPREALAAMMETYLERPYCFSVDDLVNFIDDRLLVIAKNEEGQVLLELPGKTEIERFAADFRSKTLFARAKAPMRVGESKLDFQGRSVIDLWESQNGFKVELLCAEMTSYEPLASDSLKGLIFTLTWGKGDDSDSISHEHRPGGEESVFARLSGYCTPRALEEAAVQIHSALLSAWRSLGLLGYVGPRRTGFSVARQDGTLVVTISLSEEQSALLKDAGPPDPILAELGKKFLGSGGKAEPSSWILSFLGDCLNYYYISTNRKDTMERRIRNAIFLLVEADRQENPAVQLSLCFAAIEALVCNKKEGIVDELARNVATLLRPDSVERRTAIKAVKGLYNVRSKVLHGTQVEIDLGAELQARKLAAGVLVAVIEWRLCAKRMGEESKQVPDFFNELEAATVEGRRFVGVPEQSPSWLPE